MILPERDAKHSGNYGGATENTAQHTRVRAWPQSFLDGEASVALY